jgi:hypothetical protein
VGTLPGLRVHGARFVSLSSRTALPLALMVAAMAGRETTALRAASRHGQSTPRPSPAYTAASVSPSPPLWSVQVDTTSIRPRCAQACHDHAAVGCHSHVIPAAMLAAVLLIGGRPAVWFATVPPMRLSVGGRLPMGVQDPRPLRPDSSPQCVSAGTRGWGRAGQAGAGGSVPAAGDDAPRTGHGQRARSQARSLNRSAC